MNTVRKLTIFFCAILLSRLYASGTEADGSEEYLKYVTLVTERGWADSVFEEEKPPEAWAKYYGESPQVIDQYIRHGHEMRGLIDYISKHHNDRARESKTTANILLERYVRYFSRDLAYYDPVLSEEKKREAAQALIAALQSRPCVAPPETHFGEQSYPLIAAGSYYLLSSWRHRPEVIEYIKSVEFTDHVDLNKNRVNELVRLHEGMITEVSYLPIMRPGPGKVFPVHPAARAQTEATAQLEKEPHLAIASSEAAPGPAPAPPPPPAVSVRAPATPPAKPSHALWWLLGALAALGAVAFVMRKKKPQGRRTT